MEYAKEKGASSWLNTLPILEHGFVLHKGAFRDALALRYGWKPKDMPKQCVFGRDNNVDHALSCSNGGFPSLRHNEIHDMTAEMMSTITSGVGVEPELQPLSLQPLSGEVLTHKTANKQDGAHLDVVSMGFWERLQAAFFDVRVINPLAATNRNLSLESLYKKNKREKGMPMNRESETWSMVHSPPWFSPPLEAWDLQPGPPIADWQPL